MCRILSSKYEPSLEIAFHKNINRYFSEICYFISRYKNIEETFNLEIPQQYRKICKNSPKYHLYQLFSSVQKTIRDLAIFANWYYVLQQKSMTIICESQRIGAAMIIMLMIWQLPKLEEKYTHECFSFSIDMQLL